MKEMTRVELRRLEMRDLNAIESELIGAVRDQDMETDTLVAGPSLAKPVPVPAYWVKLPRILLKPVLLFVPNASVKP